MTLDQMQADERRAALMALQHALDPGERVLFMAKAIRRWPIFEAEGVTPADVLDYTDDYDEFLNETEPFFEQFADQLPDNVSLRSAAHVLILLGKKLTPARVIALVQRAGMTEVPRYPEVEVGIIATVGGLRAELVDANHLLLMARAEQGLRAAGIPEHVITEFRNSVRQPATPGYSRNAADIACWVTFVDRWTEMPRKVYEPTRDLAVVVAWADLLGGPDGGEVRLSLDNLRSHLDMRAVETIDASLRSFYGKEV